MIEWCFALRQILSRRVCEGEEEMIVEYHQGGTTAKTFYPRYRWSIRFDVAVVVVVFIPLP